MQGWGLKAPIKDQLAAILQDYPGGQLQDEALQNAEDSHSSEFALVLDLRQHSGVDPRLSGPAFCLFDNGDGLGDREWRSLQNLNRSEKRDSPSEIGRYGMGSRSFFHYGDVTAVLSRGVYVGLDPLDTVTSHGRGVGFGGWRVECDKKESGAAVRAGQAEANALFTMPKQVTSAHASIFQSKGAGAAFRLPLRRAAEVADGLGGEITIADAEKMLVDWLRALEDGRLLLFLSSISRVSIWRWRDGQSKPDYVRGVSKSMHENNHEFSRLPPMLPEAARASYEALRQHLASLATLSRETLSSTHKAVVTITATQDGQTKTTSWLVYQRFDAVTAEVLSTIKEGSPVVPVIGLAMPMDTPDEVATEILGGLSCFLPIGDLQTGLPVHLNACFNVHKNRRDIWLPGPSLGSLGSQHVKWAKWNDTLLRHALPRLWLDAMRDLVSREHATPAHVLARLPNLEKVHEKWQPLAVTLFQMLSSVQLLPHASTSTWVSPQTSCILVLPTEAFREQRNTLQQMYKEAYSKGVRIQHNVVFIPDHLQRAMQQYSGLHTVSIETFVEPLISKVAAAKLSPVLLALAEHGDMAWHSRLKADWKNKLASIAWVPLTTGGFQTPFKSFAPEQQHLVSAQLKRVEQNTADLTLAHTKPAAVLRTVLAWGVKTELDWADVLVEARDVAGRSDVDNANRLLHYLDGRHTLVQGNKTDALTELKTIAFVPASLPNQDPQCAVTIKLQAAEQVLSLSEHPNVWAVEPTAMKAHAFGIVHKEVTTAHLISQIHVLASDGNHPDAHLLTVAQRLKQLHMSSYNGNLNAQAVREALRTLHDVAWMPVVISRGGPTCLRSPRTVIMEWSFDLLPTFCKPLDKWLALGTDFLEAAGVDVRLSGERLMKTLADIHRRNQPWLTWLLPGTAKSEVVIAADKEGFVVNLVRELAERALSDSVLRGKLCSDGCIVLTKSSTLRWNGETFLDDAQWSRGNASAEVLHGRISNDEGRAIGCTSVRDELARRCEDESFGGEDDFGQRERLADRISGLLHDYNRPSDVFTEHWQNSDDAGANDLLIMLDQTTYSTKSLVDHRAEMLQGPALILASSKALTDHDIKRIQALGDSHKCKDFSSVGRFGVGINTLYHISDTPILLANGALHVFDPLQQAVATGTKTGKRFTVGKLESEGFTDMLTPLAHLRDSWPTIFRLPLRKRPSNWKHALTVWTGTREVDKLLRDFAGQMNVEERLVFSKHVSSVEFCVKGSSGVQQIAKFELERVTEAHALMQSLPKTLAEVQALSSSPRHVIADVKIRSSSAQGVSHWIVSHALEADALLMGLVEKKFHGGVALLPHGAAALRLGAPKGYQGHWCCQLPLSELAVGFPLLIHGFFDLSTSRKVVPLPRPNETNPDLQLRWNQHLLRGPIASSLTQLIVRSRDIVKAKGLPLGSYLELFELGKGEDKAAGTLRDVAGQALLERLLTGPEVFPVVTNSASVSQQEIKCWRSGSSILLHQDPNILSLNAHDFLVRANMDLVKLSKTLVNGFNTAAASKQLQGPAPLAPNDVCMHLRAIGGDLGARIGDSTHGLINELLKFIVGAGSATMPDFTCLWGVPLQHLQSGRLGSFGSSRCFVDWCELLPQEQDHFLACEQFQILLNSHPSSRKAVLQAASAINVHSFTPADLLPYHEVLHTTPRQGVHDGKWRVAFWRLIWQYKQTQDFGPSTFSGFHNWRVVTMFTPNSELPEEVELGSISSECYSVHGMDLSWQQEIMESLRACGINILHHDHVNDANQMELIGPHICSGDLGFCTLLYHSRDKFSANDNAAKRRVKIMEFLAGRRLEFFNSQVIQMIRSVRLFLVSDQNGSARYIDLCDQSKSYICLRKDPTAAFDRVAKLMALDLPDSNVGFLSVPPGSCVELYKRLGVQTELLTSDFVVTFVCPKLPAAARRGMETLRPLLDAVVSWWDRGEDETLRAKIKDAVKDVAFVIPARGEVLVKASLLVDPELPVVKAFAEHLADKVPRSEMLEFVPFLKRLGMLSFLPGYLVARCAHALDQHCVSNSFDGSGAAPDDATQRQSILLVNALCYGYRDVLQSRKEVATFVRPRLSVEKANEIEAHLQVAAGLRIVLVHPPSYGLDDVSQYATILAKSFASSEVDLRPLSRQPALLLSSMQGLVVSTELEYICWTVHKMLARPAMREPYKLTQLDELIIEFPYELNAALGVYHSLSSVPIESLLQHLLQLSSLPNTCGFRLYTHLSQEFTSLFNVLNSRAGEISSASRHINDLAQAPCVPIRTTFDASGALGEVGSQVLLCKPTQCFFTLPQEAKVEMRKLVHEWPNAYSLDPLRHCTDIAKVLGVRQELEAQDLVKCIDSIATAAAGEALDPNEERAVVFALETLLKMSAKESLSTEPLALWLFVDVGSAKQLAKAESLVWLDQADMEHRCTNLKQLLGLEFTCSHYYQALHTSSKQQSAVPWDCERLCQLSLLRPISSILTESLHTAPERLGEVGLQEQSFEALLLSSEFTAGSRACLALSAEDSNAHDHILAELEIRWTTNLLQSILYTNASAREVRMPLSGSEADALTFAEGSVLWVQSGILTSNRQSQLYDEVGSALVKMLRTAGVPAKLHGYFPCMLACYTQGPLDIEVALRRHNVNINSASLALSKREPGMLLDVGDFQHLQQSTDFTFDADELVAVYTGVGAEGASQYRYARVLPCEGSTPNQLSLLAVYRLNEGANAPDVRRPHLELYKIQRARPAPPVPAPNLALDISNAEGSNPPAAVLDSEAVEFARLVQKLRKMESMPTEQYKQMMKRLWLQWHPDKNLERQEMADRFFKIIKRHEESYRGNGDFSWLDEANASNAEVTTAEQQPPAAQQPAAEQQAASSSNHSHERPRSWADEFEEEQRATESAVSEQLHRRESVQQRQATASPPSWRWAGGGCGVLNIPREKDDTKADAFWNSSSWMLRGASVLLEKANEGMAGLYPQSVHSSQQASELAIKSLMFRTCGITQDELKGQGAHDLTLLISRITQSGEWSCPVEGSELSSLAAAYTAARYPLNDMRQTPTDKYGQHEAQAALRTATKIRDWAALTHNLPTPRSIGRASIEMMDDVPSMEPVSLEPAPIPVPPAATPAAVEAPPIQPQLQPQHVPEPSLDPPASASLPSAPPALPIAPDKPAVSSMAGPSINPPAAKRFAEQDPDEPNSPRALAREH